MIKRKMTRRDFGRKAITASAAAVATGLAMPAVVAAADHSAVLLGAAHARLPTPTRSKCARTSLYNFFINVPARPLSRDNWTLSPCAYLSRSQPIQVDK